MPDYQIRDALSGRTITIRGDSPPSEGEIKQIFAAVNGAPRPPARAEDFVPPQTPPDLRRGMNNFAAGVADVLNPAELLEGVYQLLRHPVNTLSGIVDAQRQQLDTARQMAGEGRRFEAAGHLGAAALPILGPVAAHTGEQIGTGNPDDVANGLGRTVGLLAPIGAPRIAGATGRAVRTLPSTAREAAAGALERGAAARVADVMAPKVGANKVRFGAAAEKVASDLAADPAMAKFSREGLHGEVSSRLTQAEAKLDAAADARLSARTFNTEPIIADLLKKRRELTAEAVEASDVAKQPAGPPTTRTTMGMPGPLAGTPTGRYSAMVTAEAAPTGAPTVRTSMGVPGQSGPRTESFSRGSARAGEMNPDGVRPTVGDAPQTGQVRAAGQPLGRDVVPGPNAARVAAIDQAIAELRQLGPVARYEPLRRIRQAYDGPAKVKYNPSVTQDFLKQQGSASGAADVTGVLREHLAKFDKETAAANAEYSLYRTADDVLKATAEVQRTRPTVGRQIVARLTGSVVGGQTAGAAGAVAGYAFGPVVETALSAGVTTKLKTAGMMARLARAIRGGNVREVDTVWRQLKRLGAQTTALSTSPSGSQIQTTAPAQ